MRLKGLIRRQLVIGLSIVLLLSTLSSAISVKSQNRKSKSNAEENVKFLNDNDEQSSNSEKALKRQGLYSDDDDQPVSDSTLDSRELVKRAQNVSEEATPKVKTRKNKEHSPPNVDVITPTKLGADDSSDDENGERLAKVDLNRESRGDKNSRLYYDDATPRFPHPHHSPGGGESPFEHGSPEGKGKDGKVYFPKNYITSKYASGPKKLPNKPSPSLLHELSGKRIPDHVHFDEGGHPTHEYPSGHSHSHHHPVIGHHEEHEVGPVDESPFGHGIEEHHGKGPGPNHHPVSGYGYHHHYGSYRHTIGDKVDAVGKALQVLIPSALLITGVSALFPNRVHVPTTPIKYRQKRSVFRRRVSHRGMIPPPPLEPLPSAHIMPELEDIPSHILRAEHRIMDGNPSEMYPEYGKRYGAASAEEDTGFNPFHVFKGPGPETTMNQMIQNAIAVPGFPPMPDLTESNEKSNEYVQRFQGGGGPPPNGYRPEGPSLEEMPMPPTSSPPQRILPEVSPNLGENAETNSDFAKQRQNIVIRRRKPTRKLAKEPQKIPIQQHPSESQKSQYLVLKNIKNSIDDSKQTNQEKAEQEFMSSLQNLVTPDVAKAIVENKKEPPKEVDLSPDGPVMGLLTSYAQHENDTPACQKRALCELAIKGKNPKSTKFEAFLWSVATLVPDVFSEMYDLQEVFQSIRDERCMRFHCSNPNIDIQV